MIIAWSYLPDIVVNWNFDARVLTQIYSERCGLIESPTAGYQITPYYTGNHRPAAFLIARGPKIGESKILKDGHIVDIAPTLLTMLGVDIPKHFDGRVWEEFI